MEISHPASKKDLERSSQSLLAHKRVIAFSAYLFSEDISIFVYIFFWPMGQQFPKFYAMLSTLAWECWGSTKFHQADEPTLLVSAGLRMSHRDQPELASKNRILLLDIVQAIMRHAEANRVGVSALYIRLCPCSGCSRLALDTV